MRQVSYTTIERWPSGHHNPHDNLVVQYGRHHELELDTGSGSDDDVYVYKEGDEFYVLCVNTRLAYVGLEIFNAKDVDQRGLVKPRGEIFGQEGQVEELLGPRGTDLAPATMVRRLSEYIY